MRILTRPDSARLLAVISPRSPFGARDHALIRLALLTGLRVSELVALNVGMVWSDGQPREWLDLPAGICKGRRGRQLPLNPAAREAVGDLVAFLAVRGFSTTADAPLLTDRRHRRLPAREVERFVQLYRERSGLDLRVTPHTFRHTFCSRLVRMGVDPCSVQALSGHVLLSTLSIYLHTCPVGLVASVAPLLP